MKSEPAQQITIGCKKCNWTGFVESDTQVRTNPQRNESGEIIHVGDHYPHVAMCDCHPGK